MIDMDENGDDTDLQYLQQQVLELDGISADKTIVLLTANCSLIPTTRIIPP